jgi:hypothetical protein
LELNHHVVRHHSSIWHATNRARSAQLNDKFLSSRQLGRASALTSWPKVLRLDRSSGWFAQLRAICLGCFWYGLAPPGRSCALRKRIFLETLLSRSSSLSTLIMMTRIGSGCAMTTTMNKCWNNDQAVQRVGSCVEQTKWARIDGSALFDKQSWIACR